jgi:putative peptide zinc metalloprotease protein
LAIDPDSLLLDIEQVEMERNELLILQRQALTGKLAEITAVNKQIDGKTQRLSDLGQRLETLDIKAPHDGRFISVDSREKVGAWVQQGAELGHVIDPAAPFEFVAVVSQEHAREIFDAGQGRLRLRLVGQSEQTLQISHLVVLPYQRSRLPSAALGWMGGGDMPVLSQDNKGETSAEDFFEIRAQVAPDAENHVALVSGLKGVLSIDMPSRSVFARLYESVRQLFQKRYYLG